MIDILISRVRLRLLQYQYYTDKVAFTNMEVIKYIILLFETLLYFSNSPEKCNFFVQDFIYRARLLSKN